MQLKTTKEQREELSYMCVEFKNPDSIYWMTSRDRLALATSDVLSDLETVTTKIEELKSKNQELELQLSACDASNKSHEQWIKDLENKVEEKFPEHISSLRKTLGNEITVKDLFLHILDKYLY